MRVLSGGQASQTRGLVLGAGVATTLTVWTSLADPVQLPKLFLGGILASWILGILVVGLVSGRDTKFSTGQWALFAFVGGLVVSGLFTDVKYRAFFGTWQRHTGAIFYMIAAVMCLAAMMSFTSHGVLQLRMALIFLGVVMSFHGLLENAGHDPFPFNTLYSPLVGTLGNPDFYSGFLGVCAVATFWYAIVTSSNLVRGLSVLIIGLELFLIMKSVSVQGLVAFAIGFTLISITRLWQWKRNFGISAVIVTCIIGPIAILGILNQGPLASFLAASSLKNRFDYWRAAFEMFKAHPITGVGIDRFDEYYGQYAAHIQVVQGQMTDNAHNVFLHLLATGGLVLFIPYVALLVVIGFTGFRAILKSKGLDQMTLVGIFSLWFGLLAVSLVSIDNLGSTIWFWIVGGALYAISHAPIVATVPHGKSITKVKNPTRKITQKQNLNLLTPALSLILSLSFLLFAFPEVRSASALYKLTANAENLNGAEYAAKLKEAVLIQPSNIDVLGRVASLAGGVSNYDLAIELSKALNEKNAMSYYGNMVAAISYERKKEFTQAIPYRIRLTEIDKWSTSNMVELVKDYVAISDLVNARLIATKISTLYPNREDATTALGLVNG